MDRFKTGDIVVALSTKHCNINPREEGKEYRVFGVMRCPKCETEFICINEKHYSQTFRIKCASCGCNDIHSNHAWTVASQFRSKNHFDPYDELDRALKNEDYMRAAELRDMINSDHARQRQ